MARCYSAAMPPRQPAHLPLLWLLTDARNDAVLGTAIRRLPRGSGVVFRHHHLSPSARRRRFAEVRALCRRRGHRLVFAAGPELARRWRADGAYGSPRPGIALAAVHDLREIARANRGGAEAVLLSPVFPTRSHPGARTLGTVRFLLLARRSRAPVIALGGMDSRRASRLPAIRWAAIDGLSGAAGKRLPTAGQSSDS